MQTMRGTILAILLASAAGFASAAWTPVGGNAEALLYADPESIIKDGNRVRMTDLIEYKSYQSRPEINGVAYQSMTEEVEYDCKAKQFRLLKSSLYPYRMGEGPVIVSRPGPAAWEAVTRGTGMEMLWNRACPKAATGKSSK